MGTLRITDTCTYLAAADGPVLLVWPADQTTWDAATRSVTFSNVDGSMFNVRDGTRVVLGGSCDGDAEARSTSAAWLSSTTWVARPDSSCPLVSRWWVGTLNGDPV